MIAIGTVAKCKHGSTGLILGIKKTAWKDLQVYKGICLDRGRLGQQWQSVSPTFIGTLDDWVRLRHKELTNEVTVSVSDTPTRRNLLT